MKKLILVLFVAFTLQACSEKTTGISVQNSKWLLSEWPGQTLPSVRSATLNFDTANKVSGKSFCNGFGGEAIIKGNSVKFDQLLGTMMFCEDVGNAEKNYLDGLKATTSFKIVDNKLQLYKDATLLMVFTKTD